MSVTVRISGMEHVIDGQEWTGPMAERLNEFSATFAAELGGATPWPDYAIAEHVVRTVGGEIVASQADDLPAGVVF